MSLLPHHKRVLLALNECSAPHGEYCVNFATLTSYAEMNDARKVRRITRALARKGLAEFFRGLIDDDGCFAGSGYCITLAGRAALDEAPA